MKKINVGVIVGSLRKNSYSLGAAEALMKNAPDNLDFEIIEVGHLPLYNQDYDTDSPASYTEFREKVTSKDAFLFVTPEYNRSVPAVLKNALDIASRPWGQNVWSGKPSGVVSVSISNLGAFGANHHLRQTLVFLNMPTMAQPEAYVGNAMALFDENGKLKSEDTEKFFKDYMNALSKWFEKTVA